MSNDIDKISLAFEQERASAAHVFDIGELPMSYELITSEWLTKILCQNRTDIRVSSFELGKADNGSTNRRRLKLFYEPGDRQGSLPSSVFCKATHDLGNRILCGLFGAIHSEVSFYNLLRSHVKVETPQCYFASYNDATYNSMIILEDISNRINCFCSHATPMNKSRIQNQLKLLADVHGTFLNEKSKNIDLSLIQTWPDYFKNATRFNLQNATERGIEKAKDIIPASIYQRRCEIWPAVQAAVEKHKSLPGTITHNDVHLGNWYVVNGDSMGLADWGCCTVGHWSRDLAYTIVTALPVEQRRLWERELVYFYIEELKKFGIKDINFDSTWELYRRQLISVVPWWAPAYAPEKEMPEGMQPMDTVEEFLLRIFTAIEDQDVLNLF